MTNALMLDTDRFLDAIRTAAAESGAFRTVERAGQELRCTARDVDACYAIVPQAGGWWVRLATPDRWLSESIEADLMHHGDPIEELVEEELVELGHDPSRDGAMPRVKHFRSEDKLYTFENPLPIDPAADATAGARVAARFLLAYEAAFRQLGDMAGGDD